MQQYDASISSLTKNVDGSSTNDNYAVKAISTPILRNCRSRHKARPLWTPFSHVPLWPNVEIQKRILGPRGQRSVLGALIVEMLVIQGKSVHQAKCIFIYNGVEPIIYLSNIHQVFWSFLSFWLTELFDRSCTLQFFLASKSVRFSFYSSDTGTFCFLSGLLNPYSMYSNSDWLWLFSIRWSSLYFPLSFPSWSELVADAQTGGA